MRTASNFSTVLKFSIAVMNSSWHRDTHSTHGASQALRFNGPLPPQRRGRPVQVRRKSAWMPRAAGVLAFAALVVGMMAAGSETCTAQETADTGSYAQSTLSPVTLPGTSTASARKHAGACRHARKAARLSHPKPAL